MLYALSLGFGNEGADERELSFVYEGEGFRAVPAMLSVIGASSKPSARELGIDRSKRVHGAQTVIYHSSPPVAGASTMLSGVVACYDKGAESGAIIITETEVRDASCNRLMATVRMTSFARADGGFGGPSGSDAVYPAPDRPPDRVVPVKTSANQALLFRLLRDRNPLHADPASARAAGFDRPILHGLCQFGIAYRVALAQFMEFDTSRIREQHVRFSGPVYPGETLQFSFWQADEELFFNATVEGRSKPVMSHGHFHFRRDR